MTVQATIVFATTFLENDNVLTFYERIFNLANHSCTFNGRCAYSNGTVGVDEKNFVEFNSIALFCLIAEILNEQFFAVFGLELLSFDFYNCVH